MYGFLFCEGEKVILILFILWFQIKNIFFLNKCQIYFLAIKKIVVALYYIWLLSLQFLILPQKLYTCFFFLPEFLLSFKLILNLIQKYFFLEIQWKFLHVRGTFGDSAAF